MWVDMALQRPRVMPWVVAVAMWVAACAVVPLWVVWDGKRTKHRPVEILIHDMQHDVNPDAAATVLSSKVIDSIRALKERGQQDDRAGEIARNSIQFFKQEIER